jgi:hypothetical protein
MVMIKAAFSAGVRFQVVNESGWSGAQTIEGKCMLDRSLKAEFESYRRTLSNDEARRAFDEQIERLLMRHGVDYVRGYVDALKDSIAP